MFLRHDSLPSRLSSSSGIFASLAALHISLISFASCRRTGGKRLHSSSRLFWCSIIWRTRTFWRLGILPCCCCSWPSSRSFVLPLIFNVRARASNAFLVGVGLFSLSCFGDYLL